MRLALQWMFPLLAFLLVFYCLRWPSRARHDEGEEARGSEFVADPPRPSWMTAIAWFVTAVAGCALLFAVMGIEA